MSLKQLRPDGPIFLVPEGMPNPPDADPLPQMQPPTPGCRPPPLEGDPPDADPLPLDTDRQV